MSKTIHLQVTEAKGLWEKGIGLISKTPTPMLLRTRWGIHTFGMKYPIDVVVLNKKMHVVACKKALKPWQIYMWNPIYTTIIELPEHSLHTYQIAVGDKIDLCK